MDSDEKLKLFGEIFATKSGRNIFFLLTKKELYCREIEDALGLKTSIVLHHIAKMRAIEIVIVTQHYFKKNKNSPPHFFYRVDLNYVMELLATEFRNHVI